MKKLSLTFFITFIIGISYCQDTVITIKENTFSFKKIRKYNYENEDYLGSYIYLYQVNPSKKLLIKHTLDYETHDCDSEAIELGDYETNDSTITFYTYWCKVGNAMSMPFGARMQIYQVTETGKLQLKTSKLYIDQVEDHTPLFSRTDAYPNYGNHFLYEKPVTKEDKQQFANFIKNAETFYHAKFVFGKEADALLNELRQRLRSRIYNKTKHWKNEYSHRGFNKICK